MRRSAGVKGVAFAVLLIVAAGVWWAAEREDMRGRLVVSYFSLGKGSATLIESPAGRRVLIDGGPDAGVLRALGQALPFYNRSLDLVVAATPDQNHAGGLADVLGRYHAATLLQPGGVGSSPVWDFLEKGAEDAQGSGTKILTARRGQVYDLGGGAYLEVLYPDRLVASAPASENCIIARLVYGDTSVLFACDASLGVQQYLAMLDGAALRSDVLVSYATPSPLLLGYVEPLYKVSSSATYISDGKTVAME